MKFECGGIHGDGDRFIPDAFLRIVDGRHKARAAVLGDDDLRAAEPRSLIGEGGGEELLLSDHDGVPLDVDPGRVVFTHGQKKPQGSARQKQNHATDSVPEVLFHDIAASSMNWVRYSHFGDDLQVQTLDCFPVP